MKCIKKLDNYLNNMTISDATNIYLCIILIIVPCLFLPYNYRLTLQLLCTILASLAWGIYFLFSKLNDTIKTSKKGNLKNTIKGLASKQIHIMGTIKKMDQVDLAIIVYLILITISALVSDYFPTTILGNIGRYEGLLTILIYFFAFLITRKYAKISKTMFNALAISLGIISTMGILEYTIILEPAEASFGNQNFFSSYLCIFLPIVMLVYIDTKKLIYLIVSTLAFGSLFAACTTGGYITFVIFFIIITIYTFTIKRKNLKQYCILLLAFIAMFIILNLLNPAAFIELSNAKSDILSAFRKEGIGFHGRIKIFENAIDMTLKHPIFGIGIETFAIETVKYYMNDPEYMEIFQGALTDKAHSEYLQISACCGIPALIMYITFIGIIGIRLWQCFLKNKNNVYVFAVRRKSFILPISSSGKYFSNTGCSYVLYITRNLLCYT